MKLKSEFEKIYLNLLSLYIKFQLDVKNFQLFQLDDNFSNFFQLDVKFLNFFNLMITFQLFPTFSTSMSKNEKVVKGCEKL